MFWMFILLIADCKSNMDAKYRIFYVLLKH